MRRALLKIQPEAPEIREPNDEEIRRQIAEAAYYRAEKRGFIPGREEEDWQEAEREVRDGQARS